jgi:hypothetical protein
MGSLSVLRCRETVLVLPPGRSGLQHYDQRGSGQNLVDLPNLAQLRYDVPALQNLCGRVKLEAAVWIPELDGLYLHRGSLGPLPVPTEHKPDFTRRARTITAKREESVLGGSRA